MASEKSTGGISSLILMMELLLELLLIFQSQGVSEVQKHPVNIYIATFLDRETSWDNSLIRAGQTQEITARLISSKSQPKNIRVACGDHTKFSYFEHVQKKKNVLDVRSLCYYVTILNLITSALRIFLNVLTSKHRTQLLKGFHNTASSEWLTRMPRTPLVTAPAVS